MEVEAPSLHSQLHLQRPAGDPSALPTRLAWLAGNTVCYGELTWQRGGPGADEDAAAEEPPEAMEYISYMKRLLLPDMGQEAASMVGGCRRCSGQGSAAVLCCAVLCCADVAGVTGVAAVCVCAWL
jgi:hypothetical protein